MSGNAVTAGIAAVVVCAAAGLGFLVFGGDSEETETGETLPNTEGSDPGGGEPAGGNSGEADPRDERTPEPTPAPEPTGDAPWVPIEDAPAQFAEVDWAATGRSLGELVPLLADVGNAASRGGFVEQAIGLRVSELQGTVFESPGLQELDVEGVYPSEVLTRPAFAANAIAATLHARGMGLSAEQLASLTERANTAHVAERAAVAQIGASEWHLLGLADAYDRRVEYFSAFEELLTARQRRGLHADGARDRVGLDPLSAAAVWDGVVRIELLGDTESMGIAMAGQLTANVSMTEKLADKARALVKVRLGEVPKDLLRRPGRSLDEHGYVSGSESATWARWCVDVLIEILVEVSDGRLDAVPMDQLRECIVPVWEPRR